MRHAFRTIIQRLREARFRREMWDILSFYKEFMRTCGIFGFCYIKSCKSSMLPSFRSHALCVLQQWDHAHVSTCVDSLLHCRNGFLYLTVVVAHFAAIKGPTTSCDICLCQEKKRHNVLCMRAMFFKDTFAATSTAGFITMLGNTLLHRVYVADKSTVSELCTH